MRCGCVAVVLIFLASCGGGRQQPEQKISDVEVRTHFEKANKLMVQREHKDIEDFIQRHQLIMDSTGTGLRYRIYTEGKADHPVPHDVVVISYRVYFLNGNPVYEVTDSSPDTVRLAEGMLVNGLEEALQLMRPGSKARLILPAHLAYGMLGDEKKIPGATPLFYDLHLISINP